VYENTNIHTAVTLLVCVIKWHSKLFWKLPPSQKKKWNDGYVRVLIWWDSIYWTVTMN